MVEIDPNEDDQTPYPWYDIVCGTCDWIIATVRIVPDDKPLERSAAVTQARELRTVRAHVVRMKSSASRSAPG